MVARGNKVPRNRLLLLRLIDLLKRRRSVNGIARYCRCIAIEKALSLCIARQCRDIAG